MEERRIIQVDADTGEQLDFQLVALPTPRPKIKEGWLMAFQDGLIKLAQDSGLTLQQWRVLAYVMGRLDFENYIHLPQIEIANAIGMQPPNVSTALRVLIEKGILTRGPKVGRVQTLRLSPSLGWKGRVRSLQEERKKRLSLVHNKDAVQRRELERRGQRRLVD